MRSFARRGSVRSWWVLVIVGAAAVFGCAQIIGADEDHEPFPLTLDDGGMPPTSDSDIPQADGGAPSCPAGEKRCNGACVPAKVEYGCGSPSCEPCSLANAATIVCKDGACVAGTCKAGFGACGDPKNGCDSDLTSTKTCTSCLAACNVDAGQVCAPTGCGADCGSLTNCGGACVDKATSAAHCGICGKQCPTTANGDPECKAGACSIACRAGFAHCDGNPAGPCVALKTFYRDVDVDGVGVVGTTKVACDIAAAGAGWAAAAGDCHDGNPNVRPGASSNSVPYAKAVGGALSYDYDCDGVEVEQFTKFMGCNGGPSNCQGGGYGLANSGRSGAGVSDFCGGPVMACSGSQPGSYPSQFINNCYQFTPVNAKGPCK
jgi:hypothetical protein